MTAVWKPGRERDSLRVGLSPISAGKRARRSATSEGRFRLAGKLGAVTDISPTVCVRAGRWGIAQTVLPSARRCWLPRGSDIQAGGNRQGKGAIPHEPGRGEANHHVVSVLAAIVPDPDGMGARGICSISIIVIRKRQVRPGRRRLRGEGTGGIFKGPSLLDSWLDPPDTEGGHGAPPSCPCSCYIFDGPIEGSLVRCRLRGNAG